MIRAGLAVVAAAAVLAGCGGDSSGSSDGSLSWVGKTEVVTPPELPRDRLLSGKLRNDSLREVRLDADKARLVDADGREVRSTVRFTNSFGHGLYSPRRAPAEGDPDFERKRLGRLALVRPGASTPVTLSWRLGPGGKGPARLEVDALRIGLPTP